MVTKNLTKETANERFQQILEYITFNNNVLHEEGENNDNQEEQVDSNGTDIQGTQNVDEPNNELGYSEQGNMDNGVPNNDEVVGDSEFSGDEDVIDITQLTDSQEETEKAVEGLDDKFNKVISLLNDFETMIKSNDEKIEDLKKEIERRNPTPKEKLELMSTKSDIFNVKPKDFWEDKEKNGNYEIVDGDRKEKYTITKSDLNSASDWKTISDSMSGYNIMNQTMKNTMPNF